MKIINPYENVDWETIQKVVSLSHGHSRKKTNTDTPGPVYQYYLTNVVTAGFQHIAFSNYYPSEPFYPLTDWFEAVPKEVLASPNAEHFNFKNLSAAVHINSLGSTYRSGNPGGVSPVGINLNWKPGFKNMLDNLQYADGGGITINHPVWSGLKKKQICEMLDYDPRVLGLEIVSAIDVASMIHDGINTGWAEDLWDEVLRTGRRCWCFAVPDHGTERTSRIVGRNILLADEYTEHECLKCYRDGRFYTKLYDSDLAFRSIAFENGTLTASAPLADSMTVTIDGVKTNYNTTSVEVSIPETAKYCRVHASMAYTWRNSDGEDENVTEQVFSNPIMIHPYSPKQKTGDFIQLFTD